MVRRSSSEVDALGVANAPTRMWTRPADQDEPSPGFLAPALQTPAHLGVEAGLGRGSGAPRTVLFECNPEGRSRGGAQHRSPRVV